MSAPLHYQVSLPPRRSPFVVGHHYRVRRDFKALRDSFVAGEELVYKRDAHSWYDGYTGYFFSQAGTAQSRVWDISDYDDDLEVWKDLFEEI
jgi:hypothetical protein